MRWTAFISPLEKKALNSRNKGVEPYKAFSVFLDNLPPNFEKVAGKQGLVRRCATLFSALDKKDKVALLRWRSSWRKFCEATLQKLGRMTTGDVLQDDAALTELSGVKANEKELAALQEKAKDIESRYKQSLKLNDRVDCLITIGTAQFLMQEAVTTMMKRKQELQQKAQLDVFNDKQLPFSKLILDAIRLANEMLIPFQNREIEKVDTALPMVAELLGVRKSIEVNPDDYTAEVPAGAIAYQNAKRNEGSNNN